MIYKVALNPSLNKTIEVEELIYDDVNKTIEESEFP
jgi:fructose-1-phosphate kinase PfkB-like protein